VIRLIKNSPRDVAKSTHSSIAWFYVSQIQGNVFKYVKAGNIEYSSCDTVLEVIA
jgi:hypothetical protein